MSRHRLERQRLPSLRFASTLANSHNRTPARNPFHSKSSSDPTDAMRVMRPVGIPRWWSWHPGQGGKFPFRERDPRARACRSPSGSQSLRNEFSITTRSQFFHLPPRRGEGTGMQIGKLLRPRSFGAVHVLRPRISEVIVSFPRVASSRRHCSETSFYHSSFCRAL